MTLSDVRPETPLHERKGLARKIAAEWTLAEIAELMAVIIRRQQNILREVANNEAQLAVLMQANGIRHQIERRRQKDT